MAGVGFSLIMPFMSLYIDTLGDFNRAELSFWSGLTYSATFFVTAVISPWWGRLADRKGRKLMLLRASFGMAIVIGLMGTVTSVYQLVGLRFLQGIFSGYISNATALMATEAPREKSGQVLGTLSTGGVSGTLLGPLIGGVIASVVGYRYTFFTTGTIMLVIFFLSLIFVKEDFKPVPLQKQNRTGSSFFKAMAHPRLIIGMLITTMIIQASNNSISPILSLYVREILHGQGNVTLVSGVIAALPGVATLLAAPQFGRLGDRIGSDKILKIGLACAILLYLPMAAVQNIWQLAILRFLVGITDACLVPSVQSLLAKYSPSESAGMVFSYNQSFQSIGNVMGPFIGSTVSSLMGYRQVFISTSVLVLINFLLVRKNTTELNHTHGDL